MNAGTEPGKGKRAVPGFLLPFISPLAESSTGRTIHPPQSAGAGSESGRNKPGRFSAQALDFVSTVALPLSVSSPAMFLVGSKFAETYCSALQIQTQGGKCLGDFILFFFFFIQTGTLVKMKKGTITNYTRTILDKVGQRGPVHFGLPWGKSCVTLRQEHTLGLQISTVGMQSVLMPR